MPIHIEAANKVFVVQRMKRSGMRWRNPSGQAVLSFRVLQKSGLFDRIWADLMDTRDAAGMIATPCRPAPWLRDGLRIRIRTERE